ncbi:unnamed protein product [Euphydryas editha]|uniref:THAP-type domain-containing protein n=1 Tax=Euphydryas editha TaxID=104508 RepID=A0AAU9U7S6_EUPED|nr:unnamed protein product [Euphydryas editha]
MLHFVSGCHHTYNIFYALTYNAFIPLENVQKPRKRVPYQRCVLCGAKRLPGSKVFLSKLPLDPNRCKQWVKAIGNEDLIHIPIEKLHELKNLCGDHFTFEDFNKNRTKLKRNAVPTQNLWFKPLPDEMFKEFPLHVGGDKLKPKKSKKSYISRLEPSTSTSNSAFTLNQDASSSGDFRINSNSFHNENISNSSLLQPSTSTSTSKVSQNTENTLFDMSTSLESCLNNDDVSPINDDISTINDDVSTITPSKIKKLQKKLERITNEYKILKKKDNIINNISSPVLKSIIEASITNSNRKSTGKHWTEFNKTVALAIYKNSPKTYKYLSQLLPFPTIRTLSRAVLPMNIDTCVDENIINNLQEKAKNLTDNEKICVLVFNTMDLKKRLIYNVNTDKIDGYEDFGGERRTGNIASCVLVTMLQGIRKNIKQPIAHYFFNGTMPIEKLAIIIEKNIRAITESGYDIIATVCDHRYTNMAALNLLKTWGNSPESHYFFIDNKKIFIIYDVPHLFKSIRNNFFRAGEMIIGNKRGKWEHLLMVEKVNHTMLHFYKITKLHVKPNIKPKMKVKCAIEVLSNTVSAILKLLSMSVDHQENGAEILQTAHIIEFLDRLFDCTNGPSSKSDIKTNIRENVKKNSFHHKLWTDYKIKLGATKFINSNDQCIFKNARCIKGYIVTLSSLQEIWSYLQSKNIEYLNLRRLNMDALEDLFTNIKHYCPPYNNPTCCQFITGLKSSIIKDLSAPIGQINCKDDGYKTLCEFQKLVFPKQDHVDNEKYVAEEMSEIQKTFKDLDETPTIYVGGYLASTLSKYNTCQTCINSIKVTNPETNTMYDCNSLREWWKDEASLTYPTEELCRLVDIAAAAFETFVQPHIYVKDVFEFCKNEIFIKRLEIDFSWLCELHKHRMAEKLLRLLSLMFIRNHCQIANKFLMASTRPNTNILQEQNSKAIETEYEMNNHQRPLTEFTVYLAPDACEN